MNEVDLEAAFIGNLGRVLAVKNYGQSVFVQLRDNRTANWTFREDSGLRRGMVIVFDDHANWVPAPKGAWLKDNEISVVRKVLDDEILIETALSLRKISKPRDFVLVVGNTIEWNEIDGVVAVVSDRPVRLRDTDMDDEYELSQFKVMKKASSPKFEDFGGYEDVVDRARELIRTQLDKKQALDAIGARPIRGVLFSGPPGTGKTLLAQIIAFESGAEFYNISGPSIVSKYVGDSENLLRRIFQAASAAERAIIFFDEIDSVASRRNQDSHEASNRLVAQFLTLMDGSGDLGGNVVVVAATNRIEEIDPALRRPGRFDWEIEFGMPTASDRYQILEKSASRLSVAADLPLEAAVLLSEDWSAAKLTSVWTEAALLAAQEDRSIINEEDFAEAFQIVQMRDEGNQ